MKFLFIAAIAASAASLAGAGLMEKSTAHQNSIQQLAGNSSVLPSQRPAYLAAEIHRLSNGPSVDIA